MPDLSTAQQLVSQLVPSLTSRASGIMQAFQGSGSSDSGNAFASGSLFDTELGQASNAREPNTNSNRDNNANKPSTDRQAEGADKFTGHEEYTAERPNRAANDDRQDPIAAPQKPSSSQSDNRDDSGAFGASGESGINETSHNSGEQLNAEASDGSSEPIGEAQDILAQAEALLQQVDQFFAAHPELASQLEAVIGPVYQSLQNLVGQLSGLAPEAIVTAGQLTQLTSGAFGKLEQFAGLFNSQQQAASSGNGQALLQNLPDDFTAALKALTGANSDALGKINNIAEAFRSLVPANTVGVESASTNPTALASNPAANAATAPALQQAAAQNAQAQAVDTVSDIQAEIKQSNTTQTQAGDNNPSFSGGNNHSSNQSSQQALAAAQTQATAQQSANSALGSARSEAASLTSNAPSANAPASAALGQGTAALTKEAASFEQILKQANKPSAAEQLQIQMKAMIKNGRSVMVVKLDPPELGQLEVKMQVTRTGRADVVINVERAATLELLQRDSRLLTEALQDAGLKADGGSLSFNLQGGNDSHGDGQQQAKNIYPIAEEEFDTEMLSVVSENYTVELNDGVNIHA